MTGIIHVCYVCRRIMFGGMPTSDRYAPDGSDEPENVSHGICSECEPGEAARIERETAEVLGRLNGEAFARETWSAARAASERKERERAERAGRLIR